MVKKIQVLFQPTGKRIKVDDGSTILDAARRAGIALSSSCSGAGNCRECKVKPIHGKASSLSAKEKYLLSEFEVNEGMRLACSTLLYGDALVDIPSDSIIKTQRYLTESHTGNVEVDPLIKTYAVQISESSNRDVRSDFSRLSEVLWRDYHVNPVSAKKQMMREFSLNVRKFNWSMNVFVRNGELVGVAKIGDDPLGFAVDVGTTKIAASLVNLKTGDLLISSGKANPQIIYGEDIISRMNYAHSRKDGDHLLATVLQKGINELLQEMLSQLGLTTNQVVDCCIVGNTAMIHLLLLLPTQYLGKSPYVPVTVEMMEMVAWELGLNISPGAYIHIPPAIGGFIGSDHVAMLLACKIFDSEKTTIAIDIGTNTEISLFLPNNNSLHSASCASGPAFEGAHIHQGMRAAPGAIEKLSFQGGEFSIKTINDDLPIGLCGSGIIDTIATLYQNQMINPHGSIQNDGPGVRMGKFGKEILLVPGENSGNGEDLVINQKDINEIQLAKGAISAGIQILLDITGTTPDEVGEVLVAGAFGLYLDVQNAVKIGLFPNFSNANFRQIGNAALAGATWVLLSNQVKQQESQIQDRATYIELISHPKFTRYFAKGMVFPRFGG